MKVRCRKGNKECWGNTGDWTRENDEGWGGGVDGSVKGMYKCWKKKKNLKWSVESLSDDEGSSEKQVAPGQLRPEEPADQPQIDLGPEEHPPENTRPPLHLDRMNPLKPEDMDIPEYKVRKLQQSWTKNICIAIVCSIIK